MVIRLVARTCIGLALLLCAGLVALSEPVLADRLDRTVTVGTTQRSYIAYVPDVPDRADTQKPWPVLIAFHPGLATGKYMETTAGFHSAPGGSDYIVVYPNGIRRTWNAGDCCGRARALGVDDLGFFRAIMADLGSLRTIEPRAYLTGFSNGAILAYHIACQDPEHVAAIAPFASAYPGTTCVPGNIPVLHLHGADDISAPVAGGVTQIKAFDTKRQQVPARQTVEAFARRNGCTTDRMTQVYSGLLKTTCDRYNGCNLGAATLCVIDDLGHTWPGAAARDTVLGRKFGPGRTDIDGTREILAFFNRQRQD